MLLLVSVYAHCNEILSIIEILYIYGTGQYLTNLMAI